MYGLLDRDELNIKKELSQFPEIEKAIIFGSRAMGNYKKGSDVDIAIVGKSINKKVLLKLYDDLNEELPLPYFFDIIHYEEIQNENLIKHIDNEGKVLYEKGKYGTMR
jgi:uncharacterized protein